MNRTARKILLAAGAIVASVGFVANAHADHISAGGSYNGVTFTAKYLCNADHTQITWHATATNTDAASHTVSMLINMTNSTDGSASDTLALGEKLTVSVTFSPPDPLEFSINVDGTDHSITTESWSGEFPASVCVGDALVADAVPGGPVVGADSALLATIATGLVVSGVALVGLRRRPA